LACFRNPLTVITARMRLLSAEQGLLRAVDRFAISNENSLTMASLKSGSCEAGRRSRLIRRSTRPHPLLTGPQSGPDTHSRSSPSARRDAAKWVSPAALEFTAGPHQGGGGPKVRIHLPPAASLQTLGPSRDAHRKFASNLAGPELGFDISDLPDSNAWSLALRRTVQPRIGPRIRTT
jgi:hypothetical protein